MSKRKKIGLGIVGFIVLMIIIGVVVGDDTEIQTTTAPEEQPSATTPAPTTEAPLTTPPTEQPTASTQEVELNYGEHAIVTHQKIIETITESLTRELAFENEYESLDYRLRKITVEDEKISVYLDLHFVPPSKESIIDEGESWLWFVAVDGIWDDNHNIIGNIYSTGYDISVLMWTWYEDDKVTPWGHAIIFNSGKPFTERSVADEWQWIDGAGMKMFE